MFCKQLLQLESEIEWRSLITPLKLYLLNPKQATIREVGVNTKRIY